MRKVGLILLLVFGLMLSGCSDKEADITDDVDKEKAQIISDMNTKLNNLASEITAASFLTITASSDMDGMKVNQTIKMKSDGSYIESSNSLDDYPIVIKIEGDKAFQYNYLDKTLIKRVYLSSASEYEVEEELDVPIDDITDFNLDFTKLNISKINNKFIVRAKLKDLLDGEMNDLLGDLYSSIDESDNGILETDVDMSFIINSKSLKLEISMEIQMKIYEETMKLPIKINYDISIDEFELLDFTKGGYTFTKPNCFEEILFETKIDEEYVLDMYRDDYLYMYFNKGQYDVSSSSSKSELSVEIYDLNQKLITTRISIPSSYVREFNSNFIIPEDGYYYVKLKNGISTEQRLNFIPLNYETVVDLNNPKELTSGSGSIEGNFDLEYYKYTALKDQVIILKNNGQDDLYLIAREYSNEFMLHKIEVGKSMRFKVTTGENDFYISNSLHSSALPYSYSFTTEETFDENGLETNWDDMDLVTDEFSDKYYTAGFGLPIKSLKLIITKRGLYKFYYECKEPDMMLQFYVVNKDGSSLPYFGGIGEVLDPGEYILKVTNNDHVYGVGKVKYEFTDIADKSLEVSLSEVDNNNVIGSFNLVNQKTEKNQIIKYYFNIDKKSSVIYDEDNIIIYNLDDEVICYGTNHFSFLRYGVIDLELGRYYFTTPKLYGDTNQIIQIGLIEVERDSRQDLNNMLVLKLNEEVSLKKDWSYDKEYFKLVITENGGYSLTNSNGRYYVYDSNFNIVNKIYDYGYQYNLLVGEYYCVYQYDTKDTSLLLELNKDW